MTSALDRAKRDLLYAALTVIVESDNDEAKRKGLDPSALLHKPPPRLRLYQNRILLDGYPIGSIDKDLMPDQFDVVVRWFHMARDIE